MTLILLAAFLSAAAALITYFRRDRTCWPRILLVVGLAGVTILFTQGYRNLQRLKPRTLTAAEQREITHVMAPFVSFHDDPRYVVGAMPPSGLNLELAESITRVLTDAKVDAYMNEPVISGSVAALVLRAPPGVSIFFVKGNDRADKFATTLASALSATGIQASAFAEAYPKTREQFAQMQKQHPDVPLSINDRQFSGVYIVVGDKPL